MRITHYTFGEIAVDDIIYTSDVIIYPQWVKQGWWRKEGHRVQMADLQEVVDAKPRTLIIGTGYYGRMQVPEEIGEYLAVPQYRVARCSER